MSAAALIRAGVVVPARPWPRHVLAPDAWAALVERLATDTLPLAALWADSQQVHALFDEPGAPAATPLVASTPIERGHYRALSPARPDAAAFERSIRDLFGHIAEGAIDQRPWLDHGRWPQRLPHAPRPVAVAGEADPPEMRDPGLAGTHQLGLGPAGDPPGGPSHLRLTLHGERIAQAEWRMGYAHRGVTLLMRGKSPRAAARFAARIAGDATVAHSLAFAAAAEHALGRPSPPRATALAAVMLAVERVAIGWSRLAALARHAARHRLAQGCGLWREQLLRASAAAFGHRLMMDVVVPGGLSVEPAAAGLAALRECLVTLGTAWARQRRLSWAGSDGGPPGAIIGERLAALQEGITRDLALAAAALSSLPTGLASLPAFGEAPGTTAGGEAPGTTAGGEGFGEALGSRGRMIHWLRLDGGVIVDAAAIDAGWAGLGLAEQALTGHFLDELKPIVNLCGLFSTGMDA